MAAKPSHGPLIAILAAMATIVIAVCGGLVYLVTSGASRVESIMDARRGPSEVFDADYRVRVTRPEGPGWELWERDLAHSWDPAGIVMLRSDACSAGVVVRAASRSHTLDEQLRALFGEPRLTPQLAPRGASGDARNVELDDGNDASFAFVHGGVLYQVIGSGSCPRALYASIEMTDGPVVPRWTTPPIENAVGRSYRVVNRVFESAATGLHVDGTEPFSVELEDLERTYGHAEVAVRHRNGTVVVLDPYLGLLPTEPHAEHPSFDVRIFGRDTRFEQLDEVLDVWRGVAVHDGGMGVALVALGPDRESVVEAVEALARRIDVLEGTRLAGLRAFMPPPSDHRVGAEWSLHNGVFREHPAESRPRLEVIVPEWAEVLAGSELDEGDRAEREGLVFLLERRDLGLGGRFSVVRSRGSSALDEIDTLAIDEALEAARGPAAGDASHASMEVVLDEQGVHERVMRIEVVVREGWTFMLEVWWLRLREELARAYASTIAQLFAVEPAPPAPRGRRHVDRRFGLVVDPGSRDVRVRSDDVPGAEAFAYVRTLSDANEGTIAIAVSDPRPSACFAIALDQLRLHRSASSLASRPFEATTLDGYPATVRTITDVGFETRLVETRVDRTTYLVAVRTFVGGDWQAELARIDLGP